MSPDDRVICIKGWRHNNGRFNQPQLHCIYTIRALCSCADIPALLFHEISNRDVRFARTLKRGEASFAAYHFRPLFDISVLEAMFKQEPALA